MMDADELQWHGDGEAVAVGSFLLKSPLAYTAPGLQSVEPSAILLSIRMQPPKPQAQPKKTDFYSSYCSYYSYEKMSKTERWGYVDWLQRGRPLNGIEGHQLLFLQGLERRCLVDGQDLDLIWLEIWRLRGKENQANYSFRHQSKQLLWYVLAKAPGAVPEEYARLLAGNLHQLNPWYNEPEILLSALVSWCARTYEHLPGWMAYECARVSPEARNTVAVQRAGPEMRQLFELRFRDRWGDSIPLSLPPKARRQFAYQPRNSSLKATSVSWRDPLKLSSVWNRLVNNLVTLYNQCQEDLRPLGLILGKENVSRQSVAVWEATPTVLRSNTHPALANLKVFGGISLEKTGFCATHIGAIAKFFDIPEKESLTPTVGRRLGTSLENCGFGIEPDARFTGKSCGWHDPAVLFSLPEKYRSSGAISSDAVIQYQRCAFVLKLAFYVALTSGSVEQETLTRIATHLARNFDWQDVDRRRYKALAGMAMMHGITPAALRAPNPLEPQQSEQTGQFLLELIGRHGRVSAPEETALRLVWKRLGLDNRQLTRELDELSSKGVIFIGEFASSGPGEKIPARPHALSAEAKLTLQLDRAVLTTLLEDTRDVQTALSAAMEVDGETSKNEYLPEATSAGTLENLPASNVEAEPSPSEIDRFGGLSPRFRLFLSAVLERDVWPLEEVQALAREQEVMLAGAVETINDWAFETLGSQLLWDDGQSLVVERSLIE